MSAERQTRPGLNIQPTRLLGRLIGDAKPVAIECNETVSSYVRDSISPNTRRAYRSDLDHFLAWGGAIPASDVLVAEYLAAHATELAVATLARRLASITAAHAARGLQSPVPSSLVQHTMKGIKRAHGRPQRRVKPLLVEDLRAILDAMGDSLIDVRDAALLLVGFAGAFRRSELVALMCDDVEPVRQGIVVSVRRSKTDQAGEGRRIGIPHARGRHCPVKALEAWLSLTGVEEGPLFRATAGSDAVSNDPLSGEAVAVTVKRRVAQIGLDPAEYSGHSLRAGLATSAAAVGVSSWKIRAQTGHASDAMLSRYVRDGEIFVDNAAGTVL